MTGGFLVTPSPAYLKALQDLAEKYGPEAVAESLMSGPRVDVQCPRCMASLRPRQETVEDRGMIISHQYVCRSCGYVIQTEYTPEYQAILDEEEAQIERERTAAYADYTRDESRRLAKGGYY